MWEALASHIFSTKNISLIGYEVVKHLTRWPLNELIRLIMLWTTGPCCLHQLSSDAVIKGFIRQNGHVSWHFLAYCKPFLFEWLSVFTLYIHDDNILTVSVLNKCITTLGTIVISHFCSNYSEILLLRPPKIKTF